jgi:hypothetical protein
MVEFLLHLGEFDRRRGYLERGYPSMFEYCTSALRLSKSAAFRRIAAARLLRRFPAAADRLRDGRLCLTTLAVLRDLLTDENCEDLLRQASGLTRDQVEALVAACVPDPATPPPDTVTPVPSPRLVWLPAAALAAVASAPDSSAPATEAQKGQVLLAVPQVPPDRVKPLSAELRVLRVTVSQTFLDELDEVKLALSHSVPDGGFEAVVRRCFKLVLERDRARRGPKPDVREAQDGRGTRGGDTKGDETAAPDMRAGDESAEQSEPRKAGDPQAGTSRAAERAAAKPPRGRSRHVPSAIRRAVWARDGGRCAYRAPDGRVCGSRHRLQLHHCEPYGVGGETSVENLSLRCAAHNRMHARRDYGPQAAAAGAVSSGRRVRQRNRKRRRTSPARPPGPEATSRDHPHGDSP